jgi:molybdopterin-biosynthesis enzyme MoeA-like protein
MMVRTQTCLHISGTFADQSYFRVSSADITYASLAKAFDQPLVHHAETLRRMAELIKHRSWVHTQNEEQKRARERMALFPANAELIFVARDIWVVSDHLSVLS